MDFEVIVACKQEVLNPEARAIHQALRRQGFTHLSQVAVAKRYLLSFTDLSPDEAAQSAEFIAAEHLTNPVAETFHIKRL